MENEHSTFQDAHTLFKTLSKNHPFAEYNSGKKSLLGRDIPTLHIGSGKKSVLLIGGAAANDPVTPSLLLRFAKDLCAQISHQNTVYGLNCSFLADSRRIVILPLCNPDGNHLVQNGAASDSPLYERQLKQNGMKNDFSAWQGNARGVHLDLNLDDDFTERRNQLSQKGAFYPNIIGEFPESEPETAYVTQLIHTLDPIFVLECGICVQNIIYTNRQDLIARIAKNTDYTVCDKQIYGIPSWFARIYQRPAAHVTIAAPTSSQSPYTRLREFLFRCLYTVSI